MAKCEHSVSLLLVVCGIITVVNTSSSDNANLCKDAFKGLIRAITLSGTHLYIVTNSDLYKFRFDTKNLQPDKLVLSNSDCELSSLSEKLGKHNGSTPVIKSMFIATHQSIELECFSDDFRHIYCFSKLNEKKFLFDDFRRGTLTFNGTKFGLDIVHQKLSLSQNSLDFYKGILEESVQPAGFNFTVKQYLTLYMNPEKPNFNPGHVLLVDSSQISNVNNLSQEQIQTYGLDKYNFKFDKLTKALPLGQILTTSEVVTLYHKRYLYFITETWVLLLKFDYDLSKPLQVCTLNLYNRQTFFSSSHMPKYESDLNSLLNMFRGSMLLINVCNALFLVYYYRRNKEGSTPSHTPNSSVATTPNHCCTPPTATLT